MQEFDVAKFYSMLKYWLVTSVVLVFAFVLPLSLASAVNLWRLDVAGVHRRERQSDVVVLLFTFVMCLALAALPFFIVGVLTAGEKGAINLSLAAWGFVPATTAIIFLILSNETSHWRTIISLAIFGAAGGIVSYLVVFFQTLSAVAAMAEEHPGAKITTISELAFGGEVLKIATVGMIVSAIFGTTQLVLSRTGTREDAMLEPSPTTDR